MGKSALGAIAAFGLTAALSGNGQAQGLDSQRQALQAISDTADRICNTVKAEGTFDSKRAKGELNAQLSGLAKALAGLGIGGEIQSNTERYAGLLRQDLPTAIAVSADCKLKVFNKLADLMLATDGKPAPKSASARWPIDTGAYEVDDVNKQLNNLPEATDGVLAKILNLFFSRPVFGGVGEADSNSTALYVFCRAQILLESYLGNFSRITVRTSISQATQNLIYLQDQFGSKYGATFERGNLCRDHSMTLADYTRNLPPLKNPYLTPAERKLAQTTLDTLHHNLSSAGI